jgi:regulator of replication initiation timing
LKQLFDYINILKDENRELKRKIYSLEINLNQTKVSTSSEIDGMKRKYSDLVEERDRLIMERELIRNKVQSVIEKLVVLESNGA